MKEQNYRWPIEPEYEVLIHDYYGMREVHQILKKPRFHSSFDIATHTNTEVRPSSLGTVIYADLDPKIKAGNCPWNHRYGNLVEILDIYGRKIIYAHLRTILVKVGDRVNFDDVIALSGCSGGSRIPHLHFEIRNGDLVHSGEKNTIDPLLLLPQRNLKSLTKEFDEEPYRECWKIAKNSPWGLTDDDIPYSRSRKYIR